MEQLDSRVFFHDLRPDTGSFLNDVIDGLSRPQKELPPKYFYDERGSALFEAICELPEYYPTRTETAIMHAHARDMARHLGQGSTLIEYGSGNSRKTRILIGEVAPVVYVPIDIASGQLRASSLELARMFSELTVVAICTDYSRPFVLPRLPAGDSRRRVIYFPGSTIGNFTVAEAREFLANCRTVAGTGGGMLIGVDLKKDAALLNTAYNDAEGVTAQFNLNLLVRLNRELGADFDLHAFRHHAFYNATLGRIEMHLVSVREQRVTLAARAFHFRRGETIHTENSYKYSVAEFQELARGAGYTPRLHWLDTERLFAVHYLTVADR
jgi:L-histidine Nalpha-methyltransferase